MMKWSGLGKAPALVSTMVTAKLFLKLLSRNDSRKTRMFAITDESNFANTLPDRKPTAIMYLSWKTTVISLKLQSCLRIPSSATTTITHPSVSCPPTYPLASAKPCILPFLDCSFFFFCAVSDISCSPCLLISSDMLLLFEWAQGRRVLGESEEFHTHYIAKILTRDLNGQITYIVKKKVSLLVTAVRIPLKQATKIVLKWRALRGIRESSECRSWNYRFLCRQRVMQTKFCWLVSSMFCCYYCCCFIVAAALYEHLKPFSFRWRLAFRNRSEPERKLSSVDLLMCIFF